jgi:Tol biopolymer transport system component
MGRRWRIQLGLLLSLLLVAAHFAGAQGRWRERRERRKAAAAQAAQPSLVSRITVLKEGGARLDWVDNKIAFDMMGPGGVFAVYVMRADGSGVKCLTCGHPDLPQRNVGQPAWDPSGRYLVLQAEKGVHQPLRFSHALTPGAGVLNDLWVLDTNTNRATLIRDVPNSPGHGTLHAHFSSDGTMLGWSEMQEKSGLKKGKEFGYWQLMVADFRVVGGRPSLANVRAFTPGAPGFYENHGFSPDGSRLLFSSNFEAKRRIENDIYVMDLRTQKITRLTDGGWNELANFSPNGRLIAYMSNAGSPGGGADYWIMDSDGSNKRRLTFFNEKGSAQFAEFGGSKIMVADSSWRPDGTAIAGYYGGKVVAESTKNPPKILLIELRPEAIGLAGSRR